MGHSLKVRLIAPILALVTAWMCLAWFVVLPFSAQRVIDRELATLNQYLSVLSEGLFPLLIGGELSNIYDQLDLFEASLDFIVDVHLFRADGTSIYPLVPQDWTEAGSTFVTVENPIGYAGHRVGDIRLLIDPSVISDPIQDQLQDVFLLLFAVVLVMTGLWMQSVRLSVLVPIDALRRAVDANGGSDAGPRQYPDFKATEFRRLADSFADAQNALERTVDDLRRARDQADAANQAKSDFLANMSHELRTPLSGVLGIADVLVHDEIDPQKRSLLNAIKGSGDRLLTLLNDILDMSRIQTQGVTDDPVPFDVTTATDETLALFTPLAHAAGLSLIAHNDGSVRLIIGHDRAFRQVLSNLVNNAIKFTPTGGVSVHLSQSMECGQLIQRCSVADTGRGIRHENLDRVFDNFSQEDESISRRFGGTGLGLTICKDLVQGMGGDISVQSDPDKGTVFAFWVPVSQAAAPQPADDVDDPNVQPLPQRRILVVDDEPINRMFLESALARIGQHHVVCVDSGAAALDVMRDAGAGIIFMDCQMPQMDGYAATRAIRAWEQGKAGPPATICALTANAMPGVRDQCLAAGMDDLLTKPISLSALRDWLSHEGGN